MSPGATDINCDQGAREALRLTPGVDYFVEAVYFLTRQEAQQFVDAFEPGVVGTAFVTVYWPGLKATVHRYPGRSGDRAGTLALPTCDSGGRAVSRERRRYRPERPPQRPRSTGTFW